MYGEIIKYITNCNIAGFGLGLLQIRFGQLSMPNFGNFLFSFFSKGRLCSSKGGGYLCHGTMAQWPVQVCIPQLNAFELDVSFAV